VVEALAPRIVLQRCDVSGVALAAPQICNRCGSFDSTWTLVTGRGTIAPWVEPARVLPVEIPYVVVNVRLDEQDDGKLIGSWQVDRLPRSNLRCGVRRRHRGRHTHLVGADEQCGSVEHAAAAGDSWEPVRDAQIGAVSVRDITSGRRQHGIDQLPLRVGAADRRDRRTARRARAAARGFISRARSRRSFALVSAQWSAGP
jgi:hypothetical protein